MKLSTEGLERPTPTNKESNLPLILIICFVSLLSLAGYLHNKGKLHKLYLSTKETLIGLNLEEKKDYLGILYRQGYRTDAAKILEQIISFSQEDNEQNRAAIVRISNTCKVDLPSLDISETIMLSPLLA